MELEPSLGLTPEEMITTFNRMYLDAWERSKEGIDWQAANLSQQIADGKKVDLSNWMLEVLEIVVSASRDGMALTLTENNRRIAQQLAELEVPVPMEEVPDDDEGTIGGDIDFDRMA